MSITSIPLVDRDGSSRPVVRSGVGTFLAGVISALSLWMARTQDRNALAELAEDKHFLADIGLTREQALREAGKPFWR
jgi:uncharacterized protein YjiS (DUF1127 family)